ncbi:hypothetical protein H257_05750 [Aphanomyces astaci]|uniref:Tc1-like transposase DDE domain-containing protein n=1 Tax=Aphanomyces astaci TaxID=112090 RepID=W4GQL1_APHAT|nr:hypothetical protein H257_05750 [Aphanomyces astaci]ETV81163.1 hypothetical protein H257_05750 [Aphanomyces astaci]|eukprot:XP_009829021.1 hypothetical protein H257_05750 [Aphanomyces astaci]
MVNPVTFQARLLTSLAAQEKQSRLCGATTLARQIRAHVVAKYVAAFLLETGHLSYDPYIKTERQTALRSVQKFVKHCGYLRDSKRGKKSLALTVANTILRDNYNFIHQHYNKNDISLYDPTDNLYVQAKARHKGHRFCFIAAIFVGGKQTKDYHGMFDHTYFVTWFGRLLDALADRGISNTIIVMDIAKYHKCLPEATPRIAWRKPDLMDPYTASVVPVVVEMASAAGHELVHSPPHHSNLQPIEFLWAIVKGDVGRQYDTSTTFHDGDMRLDSAFEAVTSAMVHGCIKKSKQDLLELHRYISTIDEDEYQSCDSDDDRGSFDGSSSGDDSDVGAFVDSYLE